MFRYVIFHVGATLSSLHQRRSSFSIPSVASSTSLLILQLFRSLTYITSTSPTSSGEPPMIYNGLYHGCANHAIEEERFNPPSTVVTLRSLPTCSVVNSKRLFCTLCAVGAAISASLLSEHVSQTSY